MGLFLIKLNITQCNIYVWEGTLTAERALNPNSTPFVLFQPQYNSYNYIINSYIVVILSISQKYQSEKCFFVILIGIVLVCNIAYFTCYLQGVFKSSPSLGHNVK